MIYEREKTFEACKNVYKLPFDFFIPELNTCIEYDGKQHFMPVDYYGGEEAYQDLKKKDIIKNNFCSISGIKLIRISYTIKKREAIEAILKENLFS